MESHVDDCLVIAVGNTGCGKSTLLTSLIFGENALVLEKQGNKTVINQRPEYLERG